MHVLSLPVWIIAWIESPSVDIELVAKDQLQLRPVSLERGFGIGRLWRVVVDESKVSGHDWNLTRLVDASEVEASKRRSEWGLVNAVDDRVDRARVEDFSHAALAKGEGGLFTHKTKRIVRTVKAMHPTLARPRRVKIVPPLSFLRSRLGSTSVRKR